MPERIVVCFRGNAAIEPNAADAAGGARPPRPRPASPTMGPQAPAREATPAAAPTDADALTSDTPPDPGAAPAGAGYLERALALKDRAEALGATMCAWSAQTFSFDLAPEDMEEAVSLAALAVDDRSVAPEQRFAVGIAHGEMVPLGEGGRLAMLSWGRPLVISVTLARIAPPGEVLLDPAMPAVRSGDLLTAGAHRGLDGVRRVRGLRLDVRQPFRRQTAESVARLCNPPLLGRASEIERLLVPPGALGVVRAEPGAGGTRLLVELMRVLAPSRALFMGPLGASREPLGALRRALCRSVSGGGDGPASVRGAPVLPERLQGALARLLAGEGLDLRTASELLDAWLTPVSGRGGLLVADDAGEIDIASLEAIAGATSLRGALRTIVRVGQDEPLAAPLTPLAEVASVTLGPLVPLEAEELVLHFLDGCMSDAGARRWARRGRFWPLAVREAVCEGIESGVLRWVGSTAEPRRRSAGRGLAAASRLRDEPTTPPARRWIEARMRYLAPGPRAALTALAVLGGDAEDELIDALARAVAGPDARVAEVASAITGGWWATRPEPGWLKLTSRTLRDALRDAIPAGEAAAWHLAAAGALRERGDALVLADAAWHASQAGERRTAAELAETAARAAASAKLEVAEAELLAFAYDQEASDGEVDDAAMSPPTYRMPPAALAGWGDGPRATPVPEIGDAGATEPPATRITTEPPATRITTEPPATRITTEPPAMRLATEPPPTHITGAAPDDHAPTPTPTPAAGAAEALAIAEAPSPPGADDAVRIDAPASDPLAKTSESPVLHMADVGGQLTDRAKQALLSGDVSALERLLGELKITGGRAELVERMAGILSLSRGAKTDALRRLRVASEVAQPPARRARALLAYGVALAAAGRTEGALLEVLTALARAREAQDRQGEQACARFLARLASATGHDAAARAWTEVARRADPTRAD